MLFVGFSSGFQHHKLVPKLTECQDGKPHISNHNPEYRWTQGCVLDLALFTQDCAPIQPRNTRVKFADDTTVVGLIGHNNQTYYRQEVQHLAEWGLENNVVLNTTKTSGRRLQEYNTAPFSSIEQRWREGFLSNSWEPTLQRTWHGHWAPPVCWRGPSRGFIFLPP